MKYLENYARAYAFGGNIGGRNAAELYRRTTLYLAPLVNPDGVDLVTGETTIQGEVKNIYPGIDITKELNAKISQEVYS